LQVKINELVVLHIRPNRVQADGTTQSIKMYIILDVVVFIRQIKMF